MGAITQAFFEALAFFYEITGDLGLAIIVFTLVIRITLLPITIPSLRAGEKIKKLQPEIKKLKEKHGKDAKALQAAQLELYKKYNVNPLAGCLPQLLQLGILILLYRTFLNFLGQSEVHGTILDPQFLWLDLSQPDRLYILPVLAALTQLVLSLMIMPATETRDIVPNKSKKKKVQEENKKEENIADMAASMQQQMMFVMPVMTGLFALTFPSGLALYWVVTTVFSIGQQFYLSGPGGLVKYWQRARIALGV